MIPLRSDRAIQCQVNGRLSLQACGQPADQVYVCEVIGPHDRHKVGEHTILHVLGGNGYACSAFEGNGGAMVELVKMLDEELDH
jgi:hypothetical protein